MFSDKLALNIARTRHRFRFLHQKLIVPSNVLVGAYHHENVGDLALAETGINLWERRGEHAALQTSSNIDIWPGQVPTLVCGGAIITEEFVSRLRKRFRNNASQIGLIGVEVARNSKAFSSESLKFLKQVPYFSLRNTQQQEQFQMGDDRVAVRSMPDVAFAMSIDKHQKGVLEAREKKILGINITPGTGRDKMTSVEERLIIKSVQREFFRTAVEAALDRNWSVEHIPFAIEDTASARKLLDGLPVRFAYYSDNPRRVFDRVRQMTAFAPSRYHSLIFAILAGVPVAPFLYARKNYWLAEEYLDGLSPFGFREALNSPSQKSITIAATQRFKLPNEVSSNLRDKVCGEFNTALDAFTR